MPNKPRPKFGWTERTRYGFTIGDKVTHHYVHDGTDFTKMMGLDGVEGEVVSFGAHGSIFVKWPGRATGNHSPGALRRV